MESPFGGYDLTIILVIMSVALVMFPLTIVAGFAHDTYLTRETARSQRLRPGGVPEPC